MREVLIGRNREVEELRGWLNSDRSEFIAVYGRRRVGKTFLIKKAIGSEFAFVYTGIYGATRKDQLLNFILALREQSGDSTIPTVDNWILAFYELKKYIERSPKSKKIIFLDELPWIDTPKSGFLSALENFWNGWCAWREDIKLIVCGSATSWIINKIIKNKGGLHNRLTHRMLITPFDLRATEEYFRVYGFSFSQMQVAECYMTMGGIPYYFSLMNNGESLAQNIDRLFFSAEGALKGEFDELYRALFKNYKNYVRVIEALAQKGIGLTRQEILQLTKLTNNGEFGKILEELELCGFIRSYLPFEPKLSKRSKSGKTKRATLYQLIDFYTLFYLRFHQQQKVGNERFWESNINSTLLNAWRGITFEMLCLCHVQQIKKSLGIGDVSTKICSWIGKGTDSKVQIDLLIDRADGAINLCEMKFSFKEFVIDKKYSENLQNKIEVFIEETGTDKSILLTLVSTKGLHQNIYSHIIQRQVKLSDLFVEV